MVSECVAGGFRRRRLGGWRVDGLESASDWGVVGLRGGMGGGGGMVQGLKIWMVEEVGVIGVDGVDDVTV